MEQDIFPLEQQLSKLSCNKKDKFAVPRRQRSRSVTLTPGVRIVKPSQQAFHSTGLLSKKHRILKEITPDTPIKHKQILDSIGLQPSLNTPAKFQSTQQYSGSTPVDTPGSIKNSRLHFRSPLAESPTNSTKRQHYIEVPSPLRQEYLAPAHTELMTGTNGHRDPPDSDNHNRKHPYQPPIAIYTAYNSDDTPESPRLDSLTAKNSFFHHINIKRHNSSKKVHHTPNPITFHMFVSRHRIQISKGFFQALEGREPYLSDFLRHYDNGTSDQDYFETNFELLGRLGHGAFADAFHVIDMNDNAEYAIKKTRQPFTGYKDCLKKLEEVKMLLHIGVHPQCISLKSAWLQFGFLYMQLELCNKGK